MTLDDYVVQKVPKTAYYIPNFISEEDEGIILQKVYSAPKPKWKQLSHRRLQNWGGIPHEKGMVIEEIPEWLQTYVKKVSDLGAFGESPPNHVLINEYLPGQGIMPHLDGPLFYPTVATISCGSHTVLNFYRRIINNDTDTDSEYTALIGEYSLLLEQRSLLILQDEMYNEYIHGIQEVCTDKIDDRICNCIDFDKFKKGNTYSRSTRISLTIRNVPKCSHFKIDLRNRKHF